MQSPAYIAVAGQPGVLGAGVTNFFNFVGPLLFPGKWTHVDPGQNFVFNNGFSQPGGSPGQLNEHNTSFTTGIDFKVTPDMLLYANVSKGFKAGSFGTISAATTAQYVPVTQESLIDYEVGFKASLADRRVNITGAAFYYDYKNKQLRAKVVDPLFGSLDALVNVPKSRVTGAEIQFDARPVQGLVLNIAGTYLHSEIKEFVGAVGQTSGTVNGVPVILPVNASFAGTPLPFTPKFSVTAGFDYTFHVASQLDTFIGAQASHQTETSGVLIPPTVTTGVAFPVTQDIYYINARTLVNANFGFAGTDNRWRVQFWGKNILNKYYWTNTTLDSDTIVRYTGRPREIGVTVSAKF